MFNNIFSKYSITIIQELWNFCGILNFINYFTSNNQYFDKINLKIPSNKYLPWYKLINSGLCISFDKKEKIKILEEDFHCYSFNSTPWRELIISNGCYYLKIELNDNIIHLINTHLCSDNISFCDIVINYNKKYRLRQFNELYNFLKKKNLNSEENIILGGDFNIDKIKNSDYLYLNHIMNKLNSHDLFLDKNPITISEKNSYTNKPKKNILNKLKIKNEQCLDYIFSNIINKYSI